MAAGYSKRSLVQKLGIKSGFKLAILNPPQDYENTLGELPGGLILRPSLEAGMDFIQFFSRSRKCLEAELPALKDALAPKGMLWICWPKATAKMETDLKGAIVRELGLASGLVDIKVCAVDEKWSGLKFVYRLKDRG